MSKSGFYVLFSLLVLTTALNTSFAEEKKTTGAKPVKAVTAPTKTNAAAKTPDKKRGSAAKASKLTPEQKLSYAMGVDIGIGLRRSAKQNKMYKDLNIEMLTRGLKASFANKKLELTQQEMREVVTRYRTKLIALQRAEFIKLKAKHDAYFVKIKKKKGITAHKSGLVYKIIKPGKGASPKPTDTVQAHYSVVTPSGKVLFSSKQSGRLIPIVPARSRLGVFRVAIPMMKLGAKWSIHVPAQLAFGNAGRPPRVKPMQAFVFNIELVSINKAAKPTAKTTTKPTAKPAKK